MLPACWPADPTARPPACCARGCREPAKFVAKLRTLKTNGSMLLFKCDMGAGHFSITGRFDRLKETVGGGCACVCGGGGQGCMRR